MSTRSYDDMVCVRPVHRATELYCTDCQATVRVLSDDDRRCSVCGADLQTCPSAQSDTVRDDADNDITSLMHRLLGAWGIDPTSSPTQPASDDAVAKLNTFVAGQSTTVEVAMVSKRIKGEVILVPANFGPCESIDASEVVVASPFHGGAPFTNPSSLRNKIVLLERGVCTFASKIQRAQAAGAVAVVVVQTADVWPYAMTDSSGEGTSLSIPAFMISKKQGHGLVEYLKANPDHSPHLMSIHVRKNARECVICQVDIDIGVHVVQMPCQVVLLVVHTSDSLPWCM
ncbi:hypothetical protein, variant 1 [Aphanomyces astaci]|uniref:PA domain-containing protein n=1 Tax=Aphanomyces astaci TaxID=112090 RepID=W4GQP0_APHAT|nr:hypothetical protein, variant 1 [Aphanomyces astaci]ETV81641.1 hypothetical protein, variant 1 [Aphanomyces astaci]|eukprot:XP_009828378.1 hypothetical protein, variant 1 [Aphanomyces astaci]